MCCVKVVGTRGDTKVYDMVEEKRKANEAEIQRDTKKGWNTASKKEAKKNDDSVGMPAEDEDEFSKVFDAMITNAERMKVAPAQPGGPRGKSVCEAVDNVVKKALLDAKKQDVQLEDLVMDIGSGESSDESEFADKVGDDDLKEILKNMKASNDATSKPKSAETKKSFTLVSHVPKPPPPKVIAFDGPPTAALPDDIDWSKPMPSKPVFPTVVPKVSPEVLALEPVADIPIAKAKHAQC